VKNSFMKKSKKYVGFMSKISNLKAVFEELPVTFFVAQ